MGIIRKQIATNLRYEELKAQALEINDKEKNDYARCYFREIHRFLLRVNLK